jgi:murein DD-endopeptidase MepM/ murein hydrolase activator NlpD
MPDRYHLQIDEQRAPGARQGFFPTAPVEDAGLSAAKGGIGKVVGLALDIALQKREEADMLAVEDALNQYTKWNLDYTNNPDTGIFNAPQYQFSGARGLTGKYETDAKKKADEIASALGGPKLKQAFYRKALQSSMPFYKSTQDYEAKQTIAHKDLATQTGIDLETQKVLAFPFDGEAMAGAVENIDAAVRLQMMGAPEEAIGLRMAAEASKLEGARIGVIAIDDPILALNEAKKSKYLLPSDRASMVERLKPESDSVRAQAAADALTAKFGVDADGQEAALGYIDTHYKAGPERDRVRSAYKAAAGEAVHIENMREAEEADRQRENFERAGMDFYANGRIPSSAEIEKGVIDGNYSMSQAETLYRWQEIAETRAGITKRLSRTVPGWRDMTLQRQEEAVMREAGRTDEERGAALDIIEAGIIDGDITNEYLTAAYNNMYITSEELERYKKAGAKFKGYGASVRNVHTKRLEEAANRIIDKVSFKTSASKPALRAVAKAAFYEEIEALDPKDTKYEEKLQGAVSNALSALMDMTEEDMTEMYWFTRRESEFARVAREAAEGASLASGVARPEFGRDDITLRETFTPKDLSMDLLKGVYPITSDFDDLRDGGNRLHGGHDIAAPKGTTVFAPEMFGGDAEFTVVKVVNDQGKAKTGTGNSVTLEWTDAETGEKYQMQLNHLDAASGNLKAGMTVSPGAPLGTVGNTGSVSASEGGDGSHLDMKFKVIGKNTDIFKWHTEAHRRRKNAEDADVRNILFAEDE